jgi:tetratricopeptide (TPR) repeat protein
MSDEKFREKIESKRVRSALLQKPTPIRAGVPCTAHRADFSSLWFFHRCADYSMVSAGRNIDDLRPPRQKLVSAWSEPGGCGIGRVSILRPTANDASPQRVADSSVVLSQRRCSPRRRTAAGIILAMSTPSVAAFEQEIGALLGKGDLAAAASAARVCRQAWPSRPAGWLLGSIIALLAGDPPTALRLIEEALDTRPTHPQCLLQKAECLFALGERSAALSAAEAAAEQGADVPESLKAIGEFMMQTGELRRALPLLEHALKVTSNDPAMRVSLLASRASAHRFLGSLELAQRDYEAMLAIDPLMPNAFSGLVELRRQTPEHNWMPQLQRALERLPAESESAAIVHFALAKSYEDLGDYGSSWEHLRAANRIERARFTYDPAADRELMQAMEEAFTTDEAQASPATQESPIFIVGLPRSGSTLIERILSSHPQIHQGGELTAATDAILSVALKAASAPSGGAREHAARLASLDGRAIAAEYLARSRALRPPGMRWTDKQLLNFIHCPLLLRAFPTARIVHVTRHPLALCFAIYRMRFSGSDPFAYELTEIADFYIGYRRLMQHYQRILPGRILELPYEQLVKSFEPSVRRLLEYVGLPLDAACLEFHRNPAPVVTTSSVQVRQPLYASALEQWRHFEPWLAPVRARLETAGIPLD